MGSSFKPGNPGCECCGDGCPGRRLIVAVSGPCKPLVGTTVTVRREDGSLVGTRTTALDSEFPFTSVAIFDPIDAGTYTVSIEGSTFPTGLEAEVGYDQVVTVGCGNFRVNFGVRNALILSGLPRGIRVSEGYVFACACCDEALPDTATAILPGGVEVPLVRFNCNGDPYARVFTTGSPWGGYVEIDGPPCGDPYQSNKLQLMVFASPCGIGISFVSSGPGCWGYDPTVHNFCETYLASNMVSSTRFRVRLDPFAGSSGRGSKSCDPPLFTTDEGGGEITAWQVWGPPPYTFTVIGGS